MAVPPPCISSPSPSGRPIKYPVRELKVGWSFWVPLDGRPVSRVRAQVSSALTREKRRNPSKEFTTRYLVEEGKYGIRTWRIK